MSQDRRARRVVAVVVASSALLAAGAGCRSPFQRLADSPRPAGSEPVSAVERAAIPELAPVVATTPTKASKPAPAPAQAPPPAAAGVDEEPEVESTAAVALAPTPMLDAALRRAEAAEEAERKALREPARPHRDFEPEPEPESAPVAPAPAELPAVPPTPAVETPAPAAEAPHEEPAPVEGEAPSEPEPAPKADPAVRPASAEVAAAEEPEPGPAADAATIEPETVPQLSEAEPEPPAFPLVQEPATSPDEGGADEADAEEGEGLRISTARLCRKITGFGSFEPLAANALKPGRDALVYCELAGLEYRPDGEEFVTKIATRVELVRDGDGGKVWEVSGEDEDRCRARRRDAYVGTLITLPETIAPGPYRLRLSQSDATSGRTATAEIPVTIAR